MTMQMKNFPFVSVVVPVYNGEKDISLCLEFLLSLNYPKNKFEIIVVDNNSTDRTTEIVRQFPVKLLEEKQIQSSYAARNKGIREAKGELIAFTDADCIVDKNWLRELVERGFGNNLEKETGGCGGKILSYKPQTIVEKYYENRKLYSQKNQILGKYDSFPSLITCNAIYRKKVFEELGLFDTSFISGGDKDFSWRVSLAGYKILYVPSAIVYHRHRGTFLKMCRQFFIYGYGTESLSIKYKGKIKERKKRAKWIRLCKLVNGFWRAIFKKGKEEKYFSFFDIVCATAFYLGRIRRKFCE